MNRTKIVICCSLRLVYWFCAATISIDASYVTRTNFPTNEQQYYTTCKQKIIFIPFLADNVPFRSMLKMWNEILLRRYLKVKHECVYSITKIEIKIKTIFIFDVFWHVSRIVRNTAIWFPYAHLQCIREFQWQKFLLPFKYFNFTKKNLPWNGEMGK